MTDEELAAIEAHAQAVDSRMSENCLRLIECLGTCRTAKGLLARRLEVAVAERDRLREALKRYGAHHPDCALSDSIARLRGAVPCSCGLADLVA